MLAKYILTSADFAIRPQIEDTYWMEFSRAEEFINLGYQEAKLKVPELQRSLELQ